MTSHSEWDGEWTHFLRKHINPAWKWLDQTNDLWNHIERKPMRIWMNQISQTLEKITASLYSWKISSNIMKVILLGRETSWLSGDLVVLKSTDILVKWFEAQYIRTIEIKIPAQTIRSDHFSIYYWASFFCHIGIAHKGVVFFKSSYNSIITITFIIYFL